MLSSFRRLFRQRRIIVHAVRPAVVEAVHVAGRVEYDAAAAGAVNPHPGAVFIVACKEQPRDTTASRVVFLPRGEAARQK